MLSYNTYENNKKIEKNTKLKVNKAKLSSYLTDLKIKSNLRPTILLKKL